MGLAYQEVCIALIGDQAGGYSPLRRFALILAGAITAGLALIAFTPLGGLWFETVSVLSPELADFALLPTRLMILLPASTVLLSMQRALLVHFGVTHHVTWATMIEVCTVVAALDPATVHFMVVGAVAASAAMITGRAGANLFLVPPLRKLLAGRGEP